MRRMPVLVQGSRPWLRLRGFGGVIVEVEGDCGCAEGEEDVEERQSRRSSRRRDPSVEAEI